MTGRLPLAALLLLAALQVAALLQLAACGGPAPAGTPAGRPPGPSEDMQRLAGGRFTMGTDDGFPYEGPAHEVSLDPFWIDRYEVTVARFALFVAATGYQSEAERFGWSGVFDPEAGEWRRIDGASWRYPDGPGAPPALAAEPVTQVSWNDALAYCRHRGRRLPTEAEFELAVRGGKEGELYPWGHDERPGGRFQANVWQGTFPLEDLGEDGFRGRAPVGNFPANGAGLFDIVGNVWEWTNDWYAPDYYATSPRQNPPGPALGEVKSIRGGSWMCAENSCLGFRAAARSQATPDSGLNNLGFRCAG